jgi:hypothetical protein
MDHQVQVNLLQCQEMIHVHHLKWLMLLHVEIYHIVLMVYFNYVNIIH